MASLILILGDQLTRNLPVLENAKKSARYRAYGRST